MFSCVFKLCCHWCWSRWRLCGCVCTCAGDSSALGLAVGGKGVARVTEASLGTPPTSPTGWTSMASTRSGWSACLQRGARRWQPLCPARGGPPLLRPEWLPPHSDAAHLSRLSLGGCAEASPGVSGMCVLCVLSKHKVDTTARVSSPSWAHSAEHRLVWAGTGQGRRCLCRPLPDQAESLGRIFCLQIRQSENTWP